MRERHRLSAWLDVLLCQSLERWMCCARILSENLLNGTLPDSLVNMTRLEKL
jgi:hypothetical protein